MSAYSKANNVLILWIVIATIPIYASGRDIDQQESFVLLPEGEWAIVREVLITESDGAEVKMKEQVKTTVKRDHDMSIKLLFSIVESKIEPENKSRVVKFEPFSFEVLQSEDGRISSIAIKEGKSKEILGRQLASARNLLLLAMPHLVVSVDKDSGSLRLKCMDIPKGVWPDVGGNLSKDDSAWPPPREFFVTDILDDGNIVFGGSDLNANLAEWLVWRFLYDPGEHRIIEAECSWYDLSGKFRHPRKIDEVSMAFFTGRSKVGRYLKTIVKISPDVSRRQ